MGPQRFEIVVRGRLSPTLTASIDGFECSHFEGGMTHLVGWVPDQAGLHGTFDALRDLNIELVSVNPSETAVPDDAEHRPGASTGDAHD